MYYREASEAIAKCLSTNLEDTDVLDGTLSLLEQQSPEKIGSQRRISANMDALETFKLMLDDIDFAGASPRLGTPSPPKLVIRNVDVSIRPEILLHAPGKSGMKLIGAVKLHFPRTFPLDDDAGSYVSALLQEWCRTHMSDDGTTHGPLCYVIDVGSKRACKGVKSVAQRMRDLGPVSL